ncbi:exopolysaccharide biosynthesis polyprenyl glycosylphosphotransferase [Anaerolineales bacterium]
MLFFPSAKRSRRLQLRISERRLLLVIGDIFASVVSVWVALYIWSRVGEYTFDLNFIGPRSYWFILLPLTWFFLATANDFYDVSIANNRIRSLQRLILITFQMMIVYVIVFFLAEPLSLPRLFVIYYGIASFFLTGLIRLVNPALLGWTTAPRRVLIIGTDWTALTIIQTLKQESPLNYEICGVIGKAEEKDLLLEDIPVIGTGSEILTLVRQHGVRELIVTSTGGLEGELFQGVMDAYEIGLTILPMPILYERLTGRVPVEHVNNNWAVVLPLSSEGISKAYEFLKRFFELIITLLAFVCFLVLLPVIALFIKLDSRGPIFYSQVRVGLNGRHFQIRKFRSMVENAEKETGAKFADKNDTRVTRVGRIMRKTRLDELPQLWNILRGDMSLIGPRPERPEHVQRLQKSIPFYRTRHIVRPGVTGWAQVRYHYGQNDQDSLMKLQFDLYYIRHRSLVLDMVILLRTIGKVIKMSGQ